MEPPPNGFNNIALRTRFLRQIFFLSSIGTGKYLKKISRPRKFFVLCPRNTSHAPRQVEGAHVHDKSEANDNGARFLSKQKVMNLVVLVGDKCILRCAVHYFEQWKMRRNGAVPAAMTVFSDRQNLIYTRVIIPSLYSVPCMRNN